MKKEIFKISILALLALLLCGLVIQISCKKDNCKDCSQLSNEELSFICYNQGDKVVFKNDIMNIMDTLLITYKYTERLYCNSTYCGENGAIFANFTFSYLLNGGGIGILWHGDIPKFGFSGPNTTDYDFPLSGNTQTVTINTIAYNDVYVVQMDSTSIASEYKVKIPWKIYYSKSKGLIRLYMVNGQTWSKL